MIWTDALQAVILVGGSMTLAIMGKRTYIALKTGYPSRLFVVKDATLCKIIWNTAGETYFKGRYV